MNTKKMALEVEAIMTTGRKDEGQYRGKPEVTVKVVDKKRVRDEKGRFTDGVPGLGRKPF